MVSLPLFRCALFCVLLHTCPALYDREEEAQNHERTAETNDRDLIRGGWPSDGYPWYAVARGNVLCGASLIHEDILLTAAHCDSAFPEKGKVYVGAVGSTKDGTKGKIEEVLVHPDYDDVSLDWDFMLLKLEESMQGIETIRLNSDPNYPTAGSELTIMGFGMNNEGLANSEYLQEATLDVAQTRACQGVYATSWLTRQSHWIIKGNIMLCGWAEFARRGTCFGDSGGPVVGADGTQVGVVSFGLGCAIYGTPSVSARVSAGFEWIKENVCEMSANPPCYCYDACADGSEEGAKWRSSKAPSTRLPFWLVTGSLQILLFWVVFIRKRKDDVSSENDGAGEGTEMATRRTDHFVRLD